MVREKVERDQGMRKKKGASRIATQSAKESKQKSDYRSRKRKEPRGKGELGQFKIRKAVKK